VLEEGDEEVEHKLDPSPESTFLVDTPDDDDDVVKGEDDDEAACSR